jgi:hypothetical protein
VREYITRTTDQSSEQGVERLISWLKYMGWEADEAKVQRLRDVMEKRDERLRTTESG